MTAIEWTHRPGTIGVTWNPIRALNHATGKVGHFCVHESAGCAHCYAEAWQKRLGNPVRYAAQDRDKVAIFLDERVLAAPLAWRQARRSAPDSASRKGAPQRGARPRTAFVCSMTDLFGDFHDDETIDRVFAAMALAPQHTFIVLTKRSARMRAYLDSRNGMGNTDLCRAINLVPAHLGDRHGALEMPLPNVWLGVSVEDQATADRRIPDLLSTPAALRFISAEPLLGPIDLTNLDPTGTARPAGTHGISAVWREGAAIGLRPMLDWVIAGGESGAKARPMHPDWARSLRDQCQVAGVAFFFKQWGAWVPNDWDNGMFADLAARTHFWPDGSGLSSVRVSKKCAGRLLDGVEWCQWPDARAEPTRGATDLNTLTMGAAHD
jgi:protein gp37